MCGAVHDMNRDIAIVYFYATDRPLRAACNEKRRLRLKAPLYYRERNNCLQVVVDHVCDLARQARHGPVLRTDVCRRGDCDLVGVAQCAACEYGGAEACGEGVARAYGVGDLHAGCEQGRYAVVVYDVAAVGAAGEYDGLKIEQTF